MQAEDDGPISQDWDPSEQKVVALTNGARVHHGLPSFAANPALTAAARKQDKHCADAGRLSQTLGGSLGPRVKAESYRYRSGGENLFTRRPEDNTVVNGRLHSPGHRRNIPDARYRTQVSVPFGAAAFHTPVLDTVANSPSIFEDEMMMSSVSIEAGAYAEWGQGDE